MYMDPKTYELQLNKTQGLVEVDDLIAPAIQLLNQKNYITSACCSGHAGDLPVIGYIQFDFGEMTPETLPNGWYWDGDGLMYYDYISHTVQVQEQEIRDTMRKLYEWAQSLPDAH